MPVNHWLAGFAMLVLAASAPAETPPLAAPHYGCWGFDADGMDRGINPGDDFFSFANGSWLRATEVPADRTSVGYYTALRELSAARTKAIVEALAARHADDGSAEAKVGAFYSAFMDVARIETRGRAPLIVEFDQIRQVRRRGDVIDTMGRKMTGFAASLFDLELRTDPDDRDHYGVYVSQGGLGLLIGISI
jgi:putative endopeptidase